jgi:protein SCO1/2
VVDQVLLFCYHYNPVTGQYDVLIMNVLRVAGLMTVLGVAALVFVLLRREHQVGMME